MIDKNNKHNQSFTVKPDDITQVIEDISTILDSYNLSELDELQVHTSHLISTITSLKESEPETADTIIYFLIDALKVLLTHTSSDILDSLDNITDEHIIRHRNNKHTEKR